MGLEAPDDAAVWRLDDSRSLVITVDFFPPIVDDAYQFGAIAAANALSDLYAMGATPFLALNIAAFPAHLPLELLTQILRGGAEKVREANAVVAGGHTIKDDEPKFGLVAVGLISDGNLLTKGGFQPGDSLILTKPIGSGILTTALKAGTLSDTHLQHVTEWMLRLNGPAATLASRFGVSGATDITGFGLLGHAQEAAQASGVQLVFSLPAIPLYDGAREHARKGSIPGGSADNQLNFQAQVSMDAMIRDEERTLLYDAQTSGGLLLSLPKRRQEAFLRTAETEGVPAWVVGHVTEGEGVVVSGEAMPSRST